MRARTRAAVAVPLLLLLAVAGLALPAPSQAAAAPQGYAVTTAGAALQVVSTQKPAFSIATGDLIDQTLGLVASDFGSSTSEARAASYYPGDLIAQAGQLICGQFGPCPFDPPTYPLLAEASWPTVQHASAGQGAATSSAAATATSNQAATSVASRTAGGLTIGSASSSTTSAAGADGLHVHVRSALHDVVLGPLSVASVEVTDDVLVRPDGRRTSRPHVQATGATVAGQPVALTSTPVPALAQQGLAVRLVGASSDGARSGATGLRIDVSVPISGVGAPVPGLPSLDRTYVGSLVLGQVSVVASRDEALDLPDLTVPPPPATDLPTVTPPASVVPGLGPPPVGQAVAPAVGPEPAGSVLVTRSSFAGLEELDLTDLYAVLALGAVVGLAVSRALSRRAWQDTAAA